MRTPPRAREQSPVQPNLDRARRSHENQQNARKGFDRTKKQENMRIRFEIIKNININRKTLKSKQNARRKQNRTGDLFLCHGSVTDVSRGTKCKSDMMSTVQGHLHTQAYTEWVVGQKFKVFGTQVGCGINHNSYAMAYAKRGKKPAIGCVVVLNEGRTPINLLMDL